MTSKKRGDLPSRSSAGTSKDSARTRTLRHLERILLKSTTVAGAALGFTACGGDGGGNIVCDPLPPPLRCEGDPTTSSFTNFVNWSAQWRDTGTEFVVDVTLNAYTYEADDELLFSADPEATGATVSDIARTDGELTFTCTPDAGTTEVALRVPISCNGIDEQLLLRFNVDGTPTDGGTIAIMSDED